METILLAPQIMKNNIYFGSPSMEIGISRNGNELQSLWDSIVPERNKVWQEGFRASPEVCFGCIGGGSMQLAAVILFEENEDMRFVYEWADLFCKEIISALNPDRSFTLTSQQIAEWADESRHKRRLSSQVSYDN